MIRKFQFPLNQRIPSFSFLFHDETVYVSLAAPDRCYRRILHGIWIPIQSWNAISKSYTLLSPDSQRSALLQPKERAGSSFCRALSLEFPYITRVVYIIAGTQRYYRRVEIRFDIRKGRKTRRYCQPFSVSPRDSCLLLLTPEHFGFRLNEIISSNVLDSRRL